MPGALPSPTKTDTQVSIALAFVVFVSLTMWTYFSESDGKYAIYSLPVTVFLAHLLFRGPHVVIEGSGIAMLFLYTGTAAAALALGGGANANTVRDTLIIGGFLSFFALRHRSPAFIAPICLAILTVAQVIEVSDRPMALSFDLNSSKGLAESPMAFPLGLMVLYSFYQGRWLLLFVSAILLFAAFKRITLLGVVVVVVLDLLTRLLGMRKIPRFVAVLIVLLCSIFSLFSLQIFAFAEAWLDDPNLSQGSLSLGRSEFARVLWDRISVQPSVNFLFGFAPGAADVALAHFPGSPNPHNDWLKVFYDYGLAGFAAMHVILFLMHGASRLGAMLYIYTAIIMMTDNILLYMFYFIFVYIVLSAGDASRMPARADGSGMRGERVVDGRPDEPHFA